MKGQENGKRFNGFKRGLVTDSKDSICSRTDTKGFQVSVTGPSGTNLIGDFSTLQEAEAFADQVRVIDADQSHSTPTPLPGST
jgi:hypothetical protein